MAEQYAVGKDVTKAFEIVSGDSATGAVWAWVVESKMEAGDYQVIPLRAVKIVTVEKTVDVFVTEKQGQV